MFSTGRISDNTLEWLLESGKVPVFSLKEPHYICFLSFRRVDFANVKPGNGVVESFVKNITQNQKCSIEWTV